MKTHKKAHILNFTYDLRNNENPPFPGLQRHRVSKMDSDFKVSQVREEEKGNEIFQGFSLISHYMRKIMQSLLHLMITVSPCCLSYPFCTQGLVSHYLAQG